MGVLLALRLRVFRFAVFTPYFVGFGVHRVHWAEWPNGGGEPLTGSYRVVRLGFIRVRILPDVWTEYTPLA